ncbi:MAG: hypothetical protein H7833_08130 [Magnetococcus sp. DMHC-1]
MTESIVSAVVEQLVQILRSRTDYAWQRLADNIALDFQNLPSPDHFPASHGNNVQPKPAAAFAQQIGTLIQSAVNLNLNDSEFSACYKKIVDASFRLENQSKKVPHYKLAGNQANRCKIEPDSERLFTRYLSVYDFYRAFIYKQNKIMPLPESIRSETNYFFNNIYNAHDNEAIEGWMAREDDAQALDPMNMDRYPTPAWIVPWKDAPHRYHSNPIDVIKILALPGYATQEDRANKIGLVAVSFDLPDDVFILKPTILDALDQKQSFFLPGRTLECQGMTCPLADDLQNNDTEQIGKGVPEFICKPLRVPVKINGQAMVKLVGTF